MKVYFLIPLLLLSNLGFAQWGGWGESDNGQKQNVLRPKVKSSKGKNYELDSFFMNGFVWIDSSYCFPITKSAGCLLTKLKTSLIFPDHRLDFKLDDREGLCFDCVPRAPKNYYESLVRFGLPWTKNMDPSFGDLNIPYSEVVYKNNKPYTGFILQTRFPRSNANQYSTIWSSNNENKKSRFREALLSKRFLQNKDIIYLSVEQSDIVTNPNSEWGALNIINSPLIKLYEFKNGTLFTLLHLNLVGDTISHVCLEDNSIQIKTSYQKGKSQSENFELLNKLLNGEYFPKQLKLEYELSKPIFNHTKLEVLDKGFILEINQQSPSQKQFILKSDSSKNRHSIELNATTTKNQLIKGYILNNQDTFDSRFLCKSLSNKKDILTEEMELNIIRNNGNFIKTTISKDDDTLAKTINTLNEYHTPAFFDKCWNIATKENISLELCSPSHFVLQNEYHYLNNKPFVHYKMDSFWNKYINYIKYNDSQFYLKLNKVELCNLCDSITWSQLGADTTIFQSNLYYYYNIYYPNGQLMGATKRAPKEMDSFLILNPKLQIRVPFEFKTFFSKDGDQTFDGKNGTVHYLDFFGNTIYKATYKNGKEINQDPKY